MGIRDELEAELTIGLARCKVGRFLDTLPPDDVAELDRVFTEAKYPVEAIRRVLLKRGFTGGITVMHRHANKDCCCVD